MSEIAFKQIRQLLARQMGVRENKVTMATRLRHDLGMDGADAWEFLDAFCEEFSVDMTYFPHDSYFGGEMVFSFVDMYYLLFNRSKLKKRELTVRELVALTETKRWIPTGEDENQRK